MAIEHICTHMCPFSRPSSTPDPPLSVKPNLQSDEYVRILPSLGDASMRTHAISSTFSRRKGYAASSRREVIVVMETTASNSLWNISLKSSPHLPISKQLYSDVQGMHPHKVQSR